MCEFDPRFKAPFTCIINGPSKSGKSTFIDYVLKNQRECTTVEGRYDFLVVWYQNWQNIYRDWGGLISSTWFHQGIPEKREEEEMLDLFKSSRQNFLVLDDIDVPEKDYAKFMTRLFTVYSHHKNLSIIYATHHLFLPNRHSVMLTRNADYLVLLASPRDKSAVRTLGFQCMPKHGGGDFLLSAYEMATTPQEGVRGRLICDWTPGTPDQLRFRETLERGKPLICYREKKKISNKAEEKKPNK